MRHSTGRLPLISFMGRFSCASEPCQYSTYLMHPIVLFLLIHLFYGRFPFYYLLPVYLGGAYLVSEIFHKFVNQPSVALGRRVGKRRQLGERAQT